MKMPYAEITMYSGMCHLDPQVELTEEQSIEIENKLAQLKDPFTGQRYYGTGVLSPTSYMVVFPENIIVNVSDRGHVRISTEVSDVEYQDTVELHAYLKELLAPALAKHQDDAKKAMDEYYEKMLRPTE
jgi:hypothetical protein